METPGIFRVFTSDGTWLIDAPPNNINCIVSPTTAATYNGVFTASNQVNNDYTPAKVNFTGEVFVSILVGDVL